MHGRSRLHRALDSVGFDVLLVGVLLVVPLVIGAASSQAELLVSAVLVAPLVMRRRAPVVSFTAIGLMLLAQVLLTDTTLYGDVALLFGLYAIAAYGPRWAVWAGLATGLLGAVVATEDWLGELSDARSYLFSLTSLATIAFASWLLGYLARTRRAYVATLEERAAQLERDAAQQAQIATAAERARIAREMHDVVAHSLSVMVVQADGALYASRRRPEQAVETLRTISATGRSSLTEMRKLLGLLRDETAGAALAPVPGAGDLTDLVAQLRDSGLPVELDVAGDLTRLDVATGLTTYRIVQEALTNTLKHAGPDVSASVEVHVTTDTVRIRVDDDGRGSSAADDGQGHGIVGIRERIAVHEGEVEAGPRPGGGFRVTAVVPLQPPREHP
ncbi:sensor histidine kinase [Aeromicrobium sp. CFBP 8757]|uniref:sensor histidine kinase n=1 Tax=Aeromicrobium sp. CFBP 8757 TaxID=2775288 RepID=UPI0017866E37|nr:sensor histidine kinase [Aeromicrobium sp. CFBP 8757]MBD8605643.1 sensor histidine kinase [Aeromicrobium sp. CFBP 8757]